MGRTYSRRRSTKKRYQKQRETILVKIARNILENSEVTFVKSTQVNAVGLTPDSSNVCCNVFPCSTTTSCPPNLNQYGAKRYGKDKIAKEVIEEVSQN